MRKLKSGSAKTPCYFSPSMATDQATTQPSPRLYRQTGYLLVWTGGEYPQDVFFATTKERCERTRRDFFADDLRYQIIPTTAYNPPHIPPQPVKDFPSKTMTLAEWSRKHHKLRAIERDNDKLARPKCAATDPDDDRMQE